MGGLYRESGKTMPKRRVGVRVSKTMLSGMHEALKTDGVGPRGKSAWVEEGIRQLLDVDAKAMTDRRIFTGDEREPNTEGEVVSLTEDVLDQITTRIVELRMLDPLLEDVQSMLIRAAIRRRIRSTKAHV